MPYKCLVLDIDDTLLNDDHVITETTKKALMEFQEKGYTLVLASGRPFEGMLNEAKELELEKFDSYIISFNGATITRMRDQERLFEKHIEMEDQQEIIRFLKEKGVATLTYDNGLIIIDKENDYTPVESQITGLPYEVRPEFFEDLDRPMLKFMGVADADTIKPIEAELGGSFGKYCNATTSKPIYLEIFHRDVSKGATLHHLSNILDIPMHEIIAVGDGNNDITMIQEAGLGIAMGNATDSLKAVADEVTLSNNEEGVVAVIEKYFN